MFGFGKKNDLIEVKFIENGKEEPFAVSNMPIRQLPDNFEIDTILDIGNEKWSIVSAIPIKKQEFTRTGRLSLYLSKIELMNPKDILFSLPSINDEIAPVSDTMTKIDQYYKIHEDDWRQIELVSDHYEEALNKELNSILDICHSSKGKYGFQKIHARKEITTPLYKTNISLIHLKKYFAVSKEFQGVAYEGQSLGINNSYAFISKSGVTIWGDYFDEGFVHSICFSILKPNNIKEFSNSLMKLLSDKKLYFVDWCRVQKINNYKALIEYHNE